ncbi:MAG: protein translocase subunit SecF [Clostridiales bacterium]|nr:protein translocase subunit SecF [Clostridiales bacterium]
MKYFAFLLSGIIIVASLVNILVHKGLNYGVDFAGGTMLRIMFKNPVSISEIRQNLGGVGLGASRIQEVGKESREFLIRTLQPPAAGEAELGLESHEILADKVIDILRTREGKEALERGLQDLNNLNLKSLVFLLEPAIPDEAEDAARKIIDYRVEKGIIGDFSELAALGVSEDALSRLREKTFLGHITVLSRETVGPQVGHDLRSKATQATIWALLGMLVYIGLRFKLAYGVAAVITLFHDVVITVGIFSATNREINLPVIAGILTIVGYSLNDTIVIFDRVRDNIKLMRKTPLEEILNTSINQTLSRTIITSGTTLLTVVALFLFGGEVINDFAFTLIIGIIVGTYSSIYQSCVLVYFWQKIFKTKKGLR